LEPWEISRFDVIAFALLDGRLMPALADELCNARRPLFAANRVLLSVVDFVCVYIYAGVGLHFETLCDWHLRFQQGIEK
jgi:hypothetical protein